MAKRRRCLAERRGGFAGGWRAAVLVSDSATDLHIQGALILQGIRIRLTFAANRWDVILRLLVHGSAGWLCYFESRVSRRGGLLGFLFFNRRRRWWDFGPGQCASSTAEVGFFAFVDVRTGGPAFHLTNLYVPPASRVLLYHLHRKKSIIFT